MTEVGIEPRHVAWLTAVGDRPLAYLTVGLENGMRWVWLTEPSEELARAAVFDAVCRYAREFGGQDHAPRLIIDAAPTTP